MTVSALAFAGMGAFAKAAADVPVVEKVVVRNLISLVIAGAVAWRAGRPFLGRRENQGPLLLRSLLGVAGVLCYFYAIDHLIFGRCHHADQALPFLRGDLRAAFSG
jgi:drug/metabolite transporter (DMT)-like permease